MFPHIMAPFSTSMLIGNRSLNSILGSCDLSHSSAFLKADGAPANKEAEPTGVPGGYSWAGSKKLEPDCHKFALV